MEQRCPTPSRGMERLPTAELTSAFTGLTTSLTSTQLGQGRAPAGSLPPAAGLAKRPWPLLGGLQQGNGLHAQQAKRR